MDEFDSGWDEPPSSLDSESLNYDIAEAMSGYEQSELRQQVLEMRDDPAMPFIPPNIADSSTPENKDTSPVDCTSLSSEIFLATRLLHDETLDSTTLTSLEGTEPPPYNENHNFNNYLGSSLESDPQQEIVDSIGLPQREALDSEFLYSSFEQLRSETQDLDYDEECSNKSWADPLPPPQIMPAPVRAISRKIAAERKPKGERKKRIVKIIKKKSLCLGKSIGVRNNAETISADNSRVMGVLESSKIDNGQERLESCSPLVITEPNVRKHGSPLRIAESNVQKRCSPLTITVSSIQKRCSPLGIAESNVKKRCSPFVVAKTNVQKHCRPLHIAKSNVQKRCSPLGEADSNLPNSPFAIAESNAKKYCSPFVTVDEPNLQNPIVNVGIGEEFLVPSTSGNCTNILQKKDGRKVPSYLRMYKLRDNKYPDIFACKNCYGIFTTLDAAMFHPCLKKRRGRRPKILEDCVVPL